MSSLRVDTRHHDDTFASSPLVAWIRSYVGATSVTLDELSSGLLLYDVLSHIDPHAFTHLRIQYSVHDVTTRAHNLVEIFNGVKQFYLEKLQQLVVVKVPDVVMLVRDPNNDSTFSEMKDLLLLILGCAIQCDRKQEFIEHIKQLDVDVQRGLVLSIQEITENPDIVIPYRSSELCEMSRDEVMLVCENLYGHVQNVMEQRDDCIATLVDYLQHHDDLPSAEKRRNSSTNQRRGSQNVLLYGNNLQSEKDRITTLQCELDDQNIVMVEMKKQFDQLKAQFEALRAENKQLTSEASLTKRYRDELDTVQEQMEETIKTRDENQKLKQVVEEMECYRNKSEKMEEKMALLLKQKLSLEEQVRDQVCKIHKLELVETENERLCEQVSALLEEQNEDQKQIRDLVDQVVKVTSEKQESVNMCASLTNQIKGLCEESSPGSPDVMTELNRSISEENRYQQSIFTNPDNEDLGDLQTPRVFEKTNTEHSRNVIKSLINCLKSSSDNIYRSLKDMDVSGDDVASNENSPPLVEASTDTKISRFADLIHKWGNGSLSVDMMNRLDEILSIPLNEKDASIESTSNSSRKWEDIENSMKEKDKRIVELEMRLTSMSDLSSENDNMRNELTTKEEDIRRLEERVSQLKEQTRCREEKEAKVVSEVNRLNAENCQLKQQREKAIEKLGNHLENSKKLLNKHCAGTSTNVEDIEVKCYCKNERKISGRKKPSTDQTMDYLKESLNNLNNYSNSNRKVSRTERPLSPDENMWALEDNLDRVKELKYINEQLKDIMKIKEEKVTKIKEALIRVTNQQDEPTISNGNNNSSRNQKSSNNNIINNNKSNSYTNNSINNSNSNSYSNKNNNNNNHNNTTQRRLSNTSFTNIFSKYNTDPLNDSTEYHIQETISNINELTELNNVLKGTLVVEDRTILHLSESVGNLEYCTDRGRDEMYDDDSLEDISNDDEEDEIVLRTDEEFKRNNRIDDSFQNMLNLSKGSNDPVNLHFKDYVSS